MPKEKDVLKIISKQLSEVQTNLSKQIESVDKKVDLLEGDMHKLKGNMHTLEGNMHTLEGNMHTLEGNMYKGFNMLANQIAANEKRLIAGIEQTQILLEDMRTKFETVAEGNIDHNRRLNDHEKRIDKLENQI